MKSQLDWIVTVAALVMALIAAGIFYMQKPTPRAIAEPEKVIISPPTYPAGAVTYANALPNAGGGGGGTPGMGGSVPGPGGMPGGNRGLGSGGPPPMPGGGGPGVNTNRPGGPPSGQFGPMGPGSKPGGA